MLCFRASALIVAVALSTGCAHVEGSGASLIPKVPLSASPSGGERFDFCVEPTHALHLRDAAWLAFLAADEYAHGKAFAPILRHLGFRGPDESRDDAWSSCLGDITELRKAEATSLDALDAALGTPRMRDVALGLLPPNGPWGGCARPFLKSDAYRGDVFPAPAFQRHLLQEIHPDSYVQFFTAGAVSKDGKRFVDQSTQVVFARHHDLPIVVISFRGTEPTKLSDVMVDLEMWKTKLASHRYDESWGSVHSGFLHAFETVEPLLMKKLDELHGTNTTVWVTGHSLGGALATLMAARLLERMDHGADYKLGGVYTFGSPRVGDDTFTQAFGAAVLRHNVRSVRFRNASDAVTTVPGLSFDYGHVGTLAYLTEHALVLQPDEDPPYEMATIDDHDIAGMGLGGVPISGYYRRLEALEKSGRFTELDACASPPTP